MIQFHLSKSLSSDLAMHLGEQVAVDTRAMQWYGHRIHVQRRKCIIMMELQSRYCMVFCGLTKPDFMKFPELFADCLWREVASICQRGDAQSAKLKMLANAVAADQSYQVGHNRSVQSHINDVAWYLDYRAWRAGRLPDGPEEEFAFAVQMNDNLRRYKGQKDYFVPIEVFRDCWLGMLEQIHN